MQASKQNNIVFTVYETTNLVNGKIYVGVHKTKNPNDKYLGSGDLIGNAIIKYGKENFVKRILHLCETAEEAYSLESKIVNREFVSREDTYNLTRGGNGGRGNGGRKGRKQSPEIIERRTAKIRGRKYTEEQLLNLKLRWETYGHPSLGHKQTPEHIEKKRLKKIGTKDPPETRKKKSLAKQGEKHHMYGRTAEKCPRYDHTVYHFTHPEHGIIKDTRYNLTNRFNLQPGKMGGVVNGSGQHKGWRITEDSPRTPTYKTKNGEVAPQKSKATCKQ